ncbi:MAG: AsmA-like C-terminal region-containing protein [Paludibacteraceae bacterium]|nr:AsmA-like C-terminal region-containing protein [Paludibacteraceae bacterium]
MKKFWKIFGISVGSLLGVVIIAIIIVCNVIVTPKQLTPLLNKYAHEFITCQYSFDEVELTFFSSFPEFALRANNVTLINPTEGAQSDTLLHVESVSGVINAGDFIHAFFNEDRIVLNIHGLAISNGTANIYQGKDGICNYDIIAPSDDDEEESTIIFQYCGFDKIDLNGIEASIRMPETEASVKNIKLSAGGRFFAEEVSADGKFVLSADDIYGKIKDIKADCKRIELEGEGIFSNMHFSGEGKLKTENVNLAINNEKMIDNRDIEITMPCDVNVEYTYANLYDGFNVKIDNNEIDLKGKAEMCENGDIYLGIDFETNVWDINKTLALVPAQYLKDVDFLKKLKTDGTFKIDGKINGTLAENNFPLIFANIELDKCNADIEGIPYHLAVEKAKLYADINLNEKSNVTIHELNAAADDMKFDITGNVDDLLGHMTCDMHVKGNADLERLKEVIPDKLKLKLGGNTDIDLKANFALDDAINIRLDKIKANGTIAYKSLNVRYNDSIFVNDSKGVISIEMPNKHTNKHFKEYGNIGIQGEKISCSMAGTINAIVKGADIKVHFGDVLNDKKFIETVCDVKCESLMGNYDTIHFNLNEPDINVTTFPMHKDPMQPGLTATYRSKMSQIVMGKALNFDAAALSFSGFTTYDKSKENILLKLNPTLNAIVADGKLKMAEIKPEIKIPSIDFKFTPRECHINKSRIQIEHSDFNLSGDVTNIKNHIEKNELLKGDLKFESDQTNVDEIMALVNGIGNSSEETKQEEQMPDEDNPFMVPKGVDIALTTIIKKAIFNDNELRDVTGKLTVKDGILIAEQMGFTSEAAEMQLTGIYRSERKNHLFCGLDFHLLNIDIHKLIKLIPSIDTIVPMLKSFEGNAEFHLAAETYLKSNYDIKFSTLRGAAAIEGKDLVLLDNKTFSTIAKYMMFNKKTKNIVDSLSVEATLFRNEVDIYPFLVSMDKWQAVLAGRHNLDMSFNYHISLTDCPLPARLGLDITGTFDDPKFKLVPCQYKALYKPNKRGAVEEQILTLKKQIADALKANVIK